MLDRLGNKKVVMPLVAIIVVFCVLSLVLYPMLNASPKNVPFAIVNLDEGADTPAGSMNLGSEMVAKMTGDLQLAEGVTSPISWSELESKAALDEAMENNEFYGALVIPADFSQKQLVILAAAAAAQAQAAAAAPAPAATPDIAAAATASPEAAAAAATAAQTQAAATNAPEAPKIEIIINQGKNVMLATTMQSALTALIDQTGLSYELTILNGASTTAGGIAAMMSGMVMVMPTFIMTLISSVLLFLIFRPTKGAQRSTRLKAYGTQLLYAVVMSLLLACAAVLMVTWIGGMDIPVGTMILFLWFGSFCLMALFIGFLDLALPLGVLVILTCFACGMSSGMLAPEMLPDFWRDWFYPWVPQHFIGNGISAVIYMGKEAWNNASVPLLITGCVGLAAMVLALLVPSKTKSVEAS